MLITRLAIAGAFLVEIEEIRDERGSFGRTFCADTFAQHGMATHFPQHSLSRNAVRGTLRGMHFQHAPHAEDKLVACVRGAVFDVCLDLRPDSPTFRRWLGFELSETNGRQFYIPKGCAHGFQTLTDNAEVMYRISEVYAPQAASGVRHDDPAFGIAWPLPVAAMAQKDRDWPVVPA